VDLQKENSFKDLPLPATPTSTFNVSDKSEALKTPQDIAPPAPAPEAVPPAPEELPCPPPPPAPMASIQTIVTPEGTVYVPSAVNL